MRSRPFPSALGLFATAVVLATSTAFAQDTPACECTDLGAKELHFPDTVFHVTEGFDVAFCGHIDRLVSPFVYSEFTMRSCGRVHGVPMEARGALQECHLYVSRSMFIVEELALLPTGADMHLERRPCWRTAHWLFLAEDSSASAIGAPTTELIATFQRPTPEQFAQLQGRLDVMKPAVYWTDEELLGQLFLCALFDANWATRFKDLRETHLLGGAMAELHNEFLKILDDRRK